MPRGRDRIVVSPGITAVRCNSCKEGTVFISTTMREMARLRSGYSIEASYTCNNGHGQVLRLIGWPLSWGRIDFNRT